MVHLNKHDINIKSKMATINLHTGRDKVCHFVYILVIYGHCCSQKSKPLSYDTLDWHFHLSFNLYTKGNKLLHFV